ncbi:nucleotide-binding protein [Baaleninema simplex]|uniref:nucleotide-binding protein n=1 Tax=Baaleninema simplex TaxID=2862350 RepID=UPI00036D6667|nr:ATP-binding protein [Baaleninema simplex]
MKIAVLSGKGGAGKTTVATNFALSLSSVGTVQLFDADVEEPNARLFVRPNFGDRSEPVRRRVPVVNAEKCALCQTCVRFCQFNALAKLGNRIVVYPEACHSCGGCKQVCTANAISEVDRDVGVLQWDTDVSGIEFWQGELYVGEESAVPTIRALIQHIDERKIAVLDAPPGTACAAVEVAASSDFCLFVAEPTPFGLHDLQMTVEAIAPFDKPWGLVINRSEGAADRPLEAYARARGLPILLKIPFDRAFAELYSRGIPFVERYPSWKLRFRDLFDRIRSPHPVKFS